MPGKPLGERVATLESYFVQTNEHLAHIEKHLETLNGAVADNSRFRIRAQAILGLVIFMWLSIAVPMVGIAIAVFQ